jgi:esterase/lipase superfamily enzyme
LRSIDKIATTFQGQAKPFNQIILAAPDVASTLFKNEAIAYQNIAERTTLYVSRKDKSLLLSNQIHQNARTGFSPPVTIVPGIDTIDVSNVDLSLLGHGFMADDRDVLRDMHELLMKNTPPEERFQLKRVSSSEGNYWHLSTD